MVAELRTSRGTYRLESVQPPIANDGEVRLMLALQRSDGIERVSLSIRIARDLLNMGSVHQDQLALAMAPWIERNFDAIREAALKSIRTERRLFELILDNSSPGPFDSKGEPKQAR